MKPPKFRITWLLTLCEGNRKGSGNMERVSMSWRHNGNEWPKTIPAGHSKMCTNRFSHDAVVLRFLHTQEYNEWRGPWRGAYGIKGTVKQLGPRQNGRHFPDDIFKWISLNENVWNSLKISLKFVPEVRISNIPALIQIMAWRRPGDKPLSEPMMVNLLTHKCVTRPQWCILEGDYVDYPTTFQITDEQYRSQLRDDFMEFIRSYNSMTSIYSGLIFQFIDDVGRSCYCGRVQLQHSVCHAIFVPVYYRDGIPIITMRRPSEVYNWGFLYPGHIHRLWCFIDPNLTCRCCFNTLRPRQIGRLFADGGFKCIFLNENIRNLIKISL